MSKVLFEITQDHLETGMRGYPVGYCTTSSVDPEKGLFYVGKAVSKLSRRSPEEVIYLLYHGKEANEKELDAFKKELIKRGQVSDQLKKCILSFPRPAHPMQHLIAALAFASTFEGTGDWTEDAINLVAKIPIIAALLINHHAGWGGVCASNPELGYMENFTQMLNVPNVNLEKLTEVMKLFNVLHYDHGGGNLSAFIAKGIASGLQDLYGSLAGSMSALAGPRHGKANQDSLAFVQEVLKKVGEDASPKQVEDYVRNLLAEDRLIFGFGHAVLRVEDPRASVLYDVAEKLFPHHPLVKITRMLRIEGPKVLKENPKISNPYPNVDAISGTVLTAAGFPYPEYYTVLFGLSRVVGISRQLIYERVEARGGKGTPIIRPKYYYKSL